MNFYEVLGLIPGWCKSKDAEREGKVLQLIYEYELKNPGSVFAKSAKDEVHLRNRTRIARKYSCSILKWPLKLYLDNWVYMKTLEHDVHKHDGLKTRYALTTMRTIVNLQSKLYPATASVLSEVRDFWP